MSRRRSHRPPLPRSCSGRTAKVTLTSRCRWPWRTQRRSLLKWYIALLQEITIVRAMPALEVRLGVAAAGGGESILLASRELGDADELVGGLFGYEGLLWPRLVANTVYGRLMRRSVGLVVRRGDL